MLIAFHSSPFSAPLQSGQSNRGFELDVDILFADSDSHDFAQGHKCEFHINASSPGEFKITHLYLLLSSEETTKFPSLHNRCHFEIINFSKPHLPFLSPDQFLPSSKSRSRKKATLGTGNRTTAARQGGKHTHTHTSGEPDDVGLKFANQFKIHSNLAGPCFPLSLCLSLSLCNIV